MTAKHLIISGDVHGVGFRDFVAKAAERAAVHGYVRNRKDGTVEALLQGREEGVEELLAACRLGPPAARVEHVEVTDAPEDAAPNRRFVVQPTE